MSYVSDTGREGRREGGLGYEFITVQEPSQNTTQDTMTSDQSHEGDSKEDWHRYPLAKGGRGGTRGLQCCHNESSSCI